MRAQLAHRLGHRDERSDAEIVADDVAETLSCLPASLPPDRLESRIVMELMIRFQVSPEPGAELPDLLHPDVRHAVSRVEDCFCRYREELVEGEAPARAQTFWVAAALRILRRAGGQQALQALLHDPDPGSSVIELPDGS